MKKMVMMVLVAALMMPALASAAQRSKPVLTPVDRQGDWHAGLGFGFRVHPVEFDSQFLAEYYVTNEVSVLMTMDIYAQANLGTFNFMPMARYHFDIPQVPGLLPFVGGGLGGYVTTAGTGGMEFAVPDWGLEYEIIPKLNVYTDMSCIHDTNFSAYNFSWRWVIAGVKYRF